MTDSLISRLQALTEPSREIDAEIALANGWQRDTFPHTGEPILRRPDGQIWQLPRYTESFDAALTLLGQWSRLTVDRVLGTAAIMTNDGTYEGEAETCEAALLIAIMKAKE